MGQPVPLPAPLRGLYTLDPFIDFDSGFARELTNYAIVNGSVVSRPAIGLSRFVHASVTKLNWFDSAANSGIERTGGDIVTLSTGVTTGNIGGSCLENGTIVKQLDLTLVCGCREPRNAAAPFASWAFTTLGITATAITSGCSHKGRLYVSDGTTIEYSDIAAVAGAMKGVYTVSAFLEGQLVLRMFSVTAQPGNNSSNVLVVFGAGGKVLVFDGAYPGSPGWDIVGNYDMPYPGSNTCILPIDGDLFVATEQYAYWFRDLFASGSQTAYDNSPSRPVQNIWLAFLWKTFAGIEPANVFYNPDYDCIVCQCARSDTIYGNLDAIANYGNNSACLVYFKQYKAWALWLMAPHDWPVINGVAIGAANQLCTLEIGSMQDLSMGSFILLETSWKTPFYNPQGGKTRILNGIKPFFRCNIAAFPTQHRGRLELIRAIYDLSDYNAPYGFYTQTTVPPINPLYYTEGNINVPPLASNLYSELCGLGGNGAGFSIQFTQKLVGQPTAGQNQQIYTASINFDDGAPFPA